MFNKMKPKAFTAEQLDAIRVESVNQSIQNTNPKSTDEENFPVFDIPVNSKVLIYVPNHTIINAETGIEELRMDKPYIHTVINGKRYQKIRCIKGLPSSTGYSGNCPLCEGTSEPWDLANEQIKEQCRIRNLDVNDKENEAVKTLKREYYGKRVIKSPEQYYTFPIVVIETNPENYRQIVCDENNMPKHKAYWYTISKSAYDKKWVKTIESIEDGEEVLTHPGGRFFTLDYTYDSKSGDYNKRDSARELQVLTKTMKNSEDIAAYFDKLTEDWTVTKSIETIYDNMFFDEEDIEAETEKILASTREKLALYQSASMANTNEGGFNLENVNSPQGLPQGVDGNNDLGSLPVAGETDVD